MTITAERIGTLRSWIELPRISGSIEGDLVAGARQLGLSIETTITKGWWFYRVEFAVTGPESRLYAFDSAVRRFVEKCNGDEGVITQGSAD